MPGIGGAGVARLDIATEALDGGGHTPWSLAPDSEEPSTAQQSTKIIGAECDTMKRDYTAPVRQ
jgi:hypothetical protein